jgi:hypothetical protein
MLLQYKDDTIPERGLSGKANDGASLFARPSMLDEILKLWEDRSSQNPVFF